MPRAKRKLESDYASGSVTASSSKIFAALDSRDVDTKTNLKARRDKPAVEKPKAKRAKKSKDADASVPEKRGAIYKKSCPKNILERLDRVISQRFFMIDRKRDDQELREEFSVLGSTANVYTVTIDKRPSCTCPDATKGNHCKHILFIYLKVLQVPQDSTHWYQKALLTSELEVLFRNAPLAPNDVGIARIRDAYAQATGRASSADAPKKPRMPGKEDDCPICYESMHNVSASTLTWCETCGNALHKECFQQWARTKERANLTCVFCRSTWIVACTAGQAKASVSSEGYINLSGAVGLSPARDTSSYYHGPRRGQRYYGYQDYD
ncbi:hypothetical protein EW145_g4583 [Phellinidium pouzarii]|uniref:SWIM-type domain-containing protein n=1 Tax=Phellinidium pouzarii TaxID=167371 RepID=A0A4S4L2Z7_9AGAM|nr:hypothetical protein EW145_g4583 [Phellinidium pouzarii]